MQTGQPQPGYTPQPGFGTPHGAPTGSGFGAPQGGYGSQPGGFGATPQPQPGFGQHGGFTPGQPGGTMPSAPGFHPGAMPALPPPAKSRTGLMIGGLLGGLAVCGLCGGGLYSMMDDEEAVAAINTTPTQPPAVAQPPVAPPATPPPVVGNVQTFTGSLAQGDRTLQSGEFEDSYEVPFRSGQRFRVRMVSAAFDTYLIVRSPSGKSHDNDDANQNDRNAQIELDADEDGAWRIVATSYAVGQAGDYVLTVETLR